MVMKPSPNPIATLEGAPWSALSWDLTASAGHQSPASFSVRGHVLPFVKEAETEAEKGKEKAPGLK